MGSDPYKELLIGCGASRAKRVGCLEHTDWTDLTTLDINPDHNPDVVWDLERLPLPFDDNAFDEIHAYEVLEHTGQQGDAEFFFDQWSDFWRILRPDGLFCGSVPLLTSVWAWGDPSHKRVIPKETLNFLSQDFYREGVGKTTVSDFRYLYKADFEVAWASEDIGDKHSLHFVLRAKK